VIAVQNTHTQTHTTFVSCMLYFVVLQTWLCCVVENLMVKIKVVIGG
jgi:hypothetical protein